MKMEIEMFGSNFLRTVMAEMDMKSQETVVGGGAGDDTSTVKSV